MQPKISVIIPVYNAENYLRDCLDSVLRQSLTELEILCVDDGSTDNSLAILREYEQQYSNIKVLTQKNQFAGVARNTGMKAATGEYLAFLDADDTLVPDSLQQLYDVAVKHDLDFVKGGVLQVDMHTEETQHSAYWSNKRFPKLYRVISFTDMPKEMIVIGDAPFNGLYKTAFIRQHGIVFNKLRCCNDSSFFIGCLVSGRRIMITDIPVVYYKINQSKSLVSVRAFHFECQIAAYYLAKEQSLKTNPHLSRIICQKFLISVFYWYYRLLAQGQNIYQMHRILKEFILQYDMEDVGQDFVEKFGYRDYFWTLRNLCLPHSLERNEKTEQERCVAKDFRSLVSVIMPVYNAQSYLCEAVESVLTQSLSSLELICIDDGSTDGSLSILQAYAAEDKRVVVLQQQHAYAGAARNKGISQARGDYIAFLDADDVMEANYLQALLAKAMETQADMVVSPYSSWQGGAKKTMLANSVRRDYLPRERDVFHYKDIPHHIFNITFGGPGGTFYRTEFLRSIKTRFLEIRRSEDFYFIFTSMLQADRIAVVETAEYLRRTNVPQSLEHTKDETPLLFLEAMNLWKKELIAQGYYQAVKQSFLNWALDQFTYNLRAVAESKSFFSIHEALKENSVTLLELDRHGSDYFYNQANYQYITQLLQYEDAQDYYFAFSHETDKKLTALANRCKKTEETNASYARQLTALANRCKKTEEKITFVGKEIAAKERELQNIKTSYSFRLGRVLTFVPRKIKGGILCYKEHGMRYTVKRILWHLGMK